MGHLDRSGTRAPLGYRPAISRAASCEAASASAATTTQSPQASRRREVWPPEPKVMSRKVLPGAGDWVRGKTIAGENISETDSLQICKFWNHKLFEYFQLSMLIYVKTFSYYRKSCQELKCLFAKERRVVDVATRVDVLEAGDPEAVAPHSANWPEQSGDGGGGTRGQHR